MNEQQNVHVVQQAYGAFGRGDIPAVLAAMSEDIEWNTPGPSEISPLAGRFQGNEQVAQFFQTMADTQEMLEFTPQEFIAQGDTVVVLGHSRIRVRDTDRTAETDWAHVFTLKDGKVIRFRDYLDTYALLQASQPESG